MNPTQDQLDLAKEQGWIARTSGLPPSANPYNLDGPESILCFTWHTAWHDANTFIDEPETP